MTDSNAAVPARPRPLLLGVLAAAVIGLGVYWLWPAAVQPGSPSNAAREQRKQALNQPGAPGTLDVPLDALKQAAPAPDGGDGEASRNPFRFYVKPPPPPAPPPRMPAPGEKGGPPLPPPVPAGPPPIPLKFIGTLDGARGGKVAIFTSTDGKGMPQYAHEGEILLGQYRVVRIGVESVTLEYLDGRGRQTIPMRG